jgi:glycosyltransferase involved in cell wall biosynthesis
MALHNVKRAYSDMMTASKVDISIIIPVKDEEKNLRALLQQIYRQKLIYKNKKIIMEIIVADAHSNDKSRLVAKAYGARIIKGGMPGVGRNNGARAARGTLLYMLDADVRITNKYFFVMTYHEFNARKLDCAVMNNKPLTNNVNKNWQKDAIKTIYSIGNIFIRSVQKTQNPRAIGTCMIFRKSSFFSVGGFDEDIYFAEDSAIAKKMVRQGFRFGVLNPKIFIHMSARRPLKQGVFRFAWNAALLDFYRVIKGEIKSQELYNKITKVKDHFEK